MKTKQEIVKEMLSSTQENIYSYEVMEKYLSQKLILSTSGKRELELALGKLQRDIDDKRAFLSFLTKYSEELQ